MISNYLKNTRTILIGFLPLLFILLQIKSSIFLEDLISILIFIIILCSFPVLRGITLFLSIFLLSTRLFLMIYHEVPISKTLESLRINLTLVSILIIVPLLAIPVKLGGYVESLKIVFNQQINKPFYFFIGTYLLTHLLSIIVNIGSITIVEELTKASKIKDKKVTTIAINRGYASSIFLSPYFPSMALVLSSLSIE